MSLPGQQVQAGRYSVVPRCLSFLLHKEKVLLIRIAEDRGSWSGLLNGVGGHIERGEDPRSAALREIKEETGLILSPVSLYLSGVVTVDVGASPGVGLYIFVGETETLETLSSDEGTPEWIDLDDFEKQSLVKDLPALLPRAIKSYQNKQPFCAVTTFDEDGSPKIRFNP
ncbi:MAG: NUDIX domain-containing protein [Chloroflexota bacterium]|nr:NUDIX domain-containing protein [Chloroflexota bacterium]